MELFREKWKVSFRAFFRCAKMGKVLRTAACDMDERSFLQAIQTTSTLEREMGEEGPKNGPSQVTIHSQRSTPTRPP
jgi:hypothetical protein